MKCVINNVGVEDIYLSMPTHNSPGLDYNTISKTRIK